MYQETENNYVNTFQASNGKEYGVREAKLKDAKSIGDLFKDVYGWNYLYPYVYNAKKFEKILELNHYFWFVGEELESKEFACITAGRLKEKSTVFVEKGLVKKSHQGFGLTNMAVECVRVLLRKPEFKDLNKIELDVRANNPIVQRFAEKIRCIPYGFIPCYNNYADKRSYNPKNGIPFTEGKLESVIYYSRFLSIFWKKRRKNIALLDNENIIYFYELLKKLNRKMKFDELTLYKDKALIINDYKIIEDYYKGCVSICGYLEKDMLKSILNKYKSWNVVEWRIPATVEGLNSQKNALSNGFIVTGYDLGINFNNTIVDSILFCNFPNGVDFKQLDELDIVEKNKPIVEKVIDSLEKLKIFRD